MSITRRRQTTLASGSTASPGVSARSAALRWAVAAAFVTIWVLALAPEGQAGRIALKCDARIAGALRDFPVCPEAGKGYPGDVVVVEGAEFPYTVSNGFPTTQLVTWYWYTEDGHHLKKAGAMHPYDPRLTATRPDRSFVFNLTVPPAAVLSPGRYKVVLLMGTPCDNTATGRQCHNNRPTPIPLELHEAPPDHRVQGAWSELILASASLEILPGPRPAPSTAGIRITCDGTCYAGSRFFFTTGGPHPYLSRGGWQGAVRFSRGPNDANIDIKLHDSAGALARVVNGQLSGYAHLPDTPGSWAVWFVGHQGPPARLETMLLAERPMPPPGPPPAATTRPLSFGPVDFEPPWAVAPAWPGPYQAFPSPWITFTVSGLSWGYAEYEVLVDGTHQGSFKRASCPSACLQEEIERMREGKPRETVARAETRGLLPGRHKVEVRCVSCRGQADDYRGERVVEIVPMPPAPRLVGPPEITAVAPVTIRGEGFPPGSRVREIQIAGARVSIPTERATAGPDGVFEIPTRAPYIRRALLREGVGIYVAYVARRRLSRDRDEETLLPANLSRVPARHACGAAGPPQLSLVPEPFDLGRHRALDVRGQGFDCESRVRVTIARGSSKITEGAIDTGGDGSFTRDLALAAALRPGDSGAYTVTATDASGRWAVKTLTVAGRYAITLDPAEATPGQRVRLRWKGLGANARGRITLDGQEVQSGFLDAGDPVIEFTVPAVASGPHAVALEDGRDGRAEATLVVSGAAAPPPVVPPPIRPPVRPPDPIVGPPVQPVTPPVVGPVKPVVGPVKPPPAKPIEPVRPEVEPVRPPTSPVKPPGGQADAPLCSPGAPRYTQPGCREVRETPRAEPIVRPPVAPAQPVVGPVGPPKAPVTPPGGKTDPPICIPGVPRYTQPGCREAAEGARPPATPSKPKAEPGKPPPGTAELPRCTPGIPRYAQPGCRE